MQLKNLRVYIPLVLLMMLIVLAACRSAQMKERSPESAQTPPAITAENDSPAANKPSATPHPAPAKRVSLPGTYELNSDRDGGGDLNRLIVEGSAKEGFDVSLIGNHIIADGERKTVLTASTEGWSETVRGATFVALVRDQEGEECRLQLAFTADTATVKTVGACRFRTNLTGDYKRIAPYTVTEIDDPEVLSRRVEVPSGELANYVNASTDPYNSVRLVTGERFIIRDVPLSRISQSLTYDPATNLHKWHRLNPADEEQEGGVAADLFASPKLAGILRYVQLGETQTFRLTAVIVTVHGGFDVFRTVYVVKVEGVDKDGKVFWEERGSEPSGVFVAED